MSKVRNDWKNIISGSGSGQGSSYFEIDINEFWLKIEATEEGNEYLLRFVGDPVEFYAHYDRVDTTPDERDWNKKKWATEKFPDSETVKKRRRICTDPYYKEEGRSQSRCPWCLKHYQRSKRWYINAIDRKTNKLMLVELTNGTMENIVKLASTESNERNYPDGPFSLNGKSPEWVILATKSSKGKVDYIVQKEAGEKLTPEDWESISNAPHNRNAKTDEEKYQLIDLELYCKPSYLAEEFQIAWFGEIVDETPKKKGGSSESSPKRDEAPAERREAPKAESRPAPAEEKASSSEDDLDESVAEGEDDQDPGW